MPAGGLVPQPGAKPKKWENLPSGVGIRFPTKQPARPKNSNRSGRSPPGNPLRSAPRTTAVPPSYLDKTGIPAHHRHEEQHRSKIHDRERTRDPFPAHLCQEIDHAGFQARTLPTAGAGRRLWQQGGRSAEGGCGVRQQFSL